MIGERETIHPDINYGTLVMRAFNIDGNEINAFYDSDNNLIFVVDNTINAQKPNVLLVINSDGDKKWDEILSNEYGVDLETIRPKTDNKYQKLDIEYSGLPVYGALIDAYNAGGALDEHLNQLMILRDSAARHSAMMRLNVANETISKTNATIVKTKEAIVRLETRVKTLRSKLSAAKKEIGKVNTKQSASKILKLESQIEATNEKLKRAKKRLESAQKRLEAATVDAELASDLLNQPSTEIKQTVKSKPVMVAPEYPVQTVSAKEEIVEETDEEFNDSDVKPLFAEDPQILNEDIAFKPITFDAPVFNEMAEVVNEMPVVEPVTENKPVLESITPIPEPAFIPEPVVEEKAEVVVEKPVLETMMPVIEEEQTVVQETPVVPSEPVAPVAPIVNNFQAPAEIKEERSKPGFMYYLLLLVLILLSVFTLWLYQRNMSTETKPVLTAKAVETPVVESKKFAEPVAAPAPVVEEKVEAVFLDEEPVVSEPEPVVVEENKSEEEPVVEPVAEKVSEPTPIVDAAPVVMDAVPSHLNTSVADDSEEIVYATEEDILATKPVYEPGAKYDNMFVDEGVTESDDSGYDYFFDEEEAAYQDEEIY